MRWPQLEWHLVLRPQVQHFAMASFIQVPDMERMSILAAEQQLGIHPVFHHLRRAPFAGDHGVMSQVPPEIVGQVLRSTISLPSSLDLKRFRIKNKDSSWSFAFRGTDGVHIHAV